MVKLQVVLLCLGIVLPNRADEFAIDWWCIASGGGESATTPSEYALTGTIGQNIAVTSSADGWQLESGFWPGPGCPFENNPNAIPAPGPFTVGSIQAASWRMNGSISANDGLRLSDVELNVRHLANEMSLPYCIIETTTLPRTRFELKPDGNDASCRSKLIHFSQDPNPQWPDAYVIEAVYNIDLIGPSHMVVTQQYIFRWLAEQIEPSETLLACKFYPMVKYGFCGHDGEELVEFSAAQRFHFNVDDVPPNSSAFFEDKISLDSHPGTEPVGGDPLPHETNIIAVAHAQKGTADNVHQTWAESIDEPGFDSLGVFSAAGCPECVHIHWRWLGIPFLGEPFSGKPLIPRRDSIPPFTYDSRQSVEVALVRYSPGEQDPSDFKTLASGEVLRESDQVFWYAGRSPETSDAFFIHGGAFSPVPQCYVSVKRRLVLSEECLEPPCWVSLPYSVWIKAPPGSEVVLMESSDTRIWQDRETTVTTEPITKIPIPYNPSGATFFKVRCNGRVISMKNERVGAGD